jgi:hypothetical protein
MGTCYQAYGMNICSEIACPELMRSEDTVDVRVVVDKIEPFCNPADRFWLEYKIEEDAIWISLDGLATFLICSGKKIVVDLVDSGAEDIVRYYLLHSAFCALMFQLGLLVLHGSVIETPAGAVVFSGASGVGKSTLAAIFKHRGYRILSDDVCVICDRDGFVKVKPSFPQLKLKADMAAHLQYDTKKAQAIKADQNKFGLPLNNGFRRTDLVLFRIYELMIAKTNEFELQTVVGMPKLLTIIRNLYRVQILQDPGFMAMLSQCGAGIVNSVGIKRAYRPAAQGFGPVDRFADFLEKDFNDEG